MEPPQHDPPTVVYRTAEVVYLLSRGALHFLEPPHMIQVQYPASHQRGPQLQDVKARLSTLRGKGMPDSFSWSYKRNYKGTFIWCDILDTDVILPVTGSGEYVLKALELIDVDSQERGKDQHDEFHPMTRLRNLRAKPSNPIIPEGKISRQSSMRKLENDAAIALLSQTLMTGNSHGVELNEQLWDSSLSAAEVCGSLDHTDVFSSGTIFPCQEIIKNTINSEITRTSSTAKRSESVVSLQTVEGIGVGTTATNSNIGRFSTFLLTPNHGAREKRTKSWKEVESSREAAVFSTKFNPKVDPFLYALRKASRLGPGYCKPQMCSNVDVVPSTQQHASKVRHGRRSKPTCSDKSAPSEKLIWKEESRAASSVSPRKSITTHTSAGDDDTTGTKVVEELTPELIEHPKAREDTAKSVSRSDPKEENISEAPKIIAKITSKQEEEASDIQATVTKIQDHGSSRSDKPPKHRYLPVPVQDKAADISFVTKTRDRHPRSSREENPWKSRGGESVVREYSTESTKTSNETSISNARRHQKTAKTPKPVTRNLASNDSPESRDPVHGSLHTTDTESISQVPETNSASDTSRSKSGSVETTSTPELLPTISQEAGSSALTSAESMRPKDYHSRDERPTADSSFPGFPRSDLDITAVRSDRQRLSVLRNDYKEITAAIEKNLITLHSGGFLKESTVSARHTEIGHHTNSEGPSPMDEEAGEATLPIAVFDEVTEGSPAAMDGVLLGDQLLKFGSVDGGDNLLMRLAREGQDNEGRGLHVVILRRGESVHLTVTPRRWSGRGLLGCHIQPL